jgi:glycosyltransferase involved in cell wall biosynthesis
MPVFNGERFIGDAVRSVLASRFADLELLVLDDGSTDDSVREAERAAAGDPRLHIVQLSHGGVAAARNAALRAARGELIANLDADDVMLPDRLERQVAFLDAHPEYVAVGSRVIMTDVEGRPLRVLIREFTHEEIDGAHLDGRPGALGNPTATFRADGARHIGGYRDDLHTTGEDHDFWLRLAEVGRLANLPEVLVRYRMHDRNASLDAADRERRHAVTLDTLARAFARRGLVGRAPAKHAAPLPRRAERWRDRALLCHFRQQRIRALALALCAVALEPTSPAARSALRTVAHRSA